MVRCAASSAILIRDWKLPNNVYHLYMAHAGINWRTGYDIDHRMRIERRQGRRKNGVTIVD